MTFLSGIFLAGMVLTGVPVLIHLFTRKRRVEMPWGAMQFLVEMSPRFRRHSIRLNELLLLLVRILAIVTLVLAFAQPMIWSQVTANSATEVILIIDGSFSTARKTGDGQSVFQQEIAAAEKVVLSLTSRNTIRVLFATDVPRWLTPLPLEVTQPNRDALRTMLGGLKPLTCGSDLIAAISDVLQSPPAPNCVSRRVVIISDSTELPWHGTDEQRWKAIKKAIETARVPTAVDVLEVTPSPDSDTLVNVSIDRLITDHEIVVTGDSVSLTAEVRNRTNRTSAALELVWIVDQKEIVRTPLPPLEADTSTTVECSIPCETPGDHIVRCRIVTEDDLLQDNDAALSIRTLEQIPLLIVDGGRKPKSEMVPESGFFLAALGYLPGSKESAKGRSAFQPTVIAAEDLPTIELSSFLCIVLANVPRLDQQQVARLVSHVVAGGGLWIALGDRTDVTGFNETFSPDYAGLSPVRLGSVVGDPGKEAPGWTVILPRQTHPALTLLGDSAQLDLNKARVQQHHTFLAPVPNNLNALLKLETQAPLVFEHPFGKGRVLLQTVPLNRTWNNLPILQVYVPMIREFLWRVSEGKLSRRNLAPGDMIRLQSAENREVPFLVHLPDSQKFSGTTEQGQLRFSGTFFPGIYRVEGISQMPDLFNVHRSPEESDLSPLSVESRKKFSDNHLRFEPHNGGESAEARVDVREQRSIASHLLWIALGLFVIEALLASLLSGRRPTRKTPVVLTPVSAA